METKHLGAGSEEPPIDKEKVRLYAMKYCPFAHRIRLTLSYKNVPHDIVNINLQDKPEWYLKKNSNGKVPALLDMDGKMVYDSTIIVNYLEEKYPEPPLHNKETEKRDLELLEQFDKITKIFFNCIHKRDTSPLKDAVDEICSHLIVFEEELNKRNSPFFKGDTPGIVDVLIWPFVERAKALPLLYKEPVEFEKEKFPFLMKWIATMKSQDFVQKNAIAYEIFAKVIEISASGKVDYDNV